MTNVNDVPAGDKSAGSSLSISKRQLDFLDAAERVELDSVLDRDELGFSSRLWAQLSLPYKNPGDELPYWSRRNGDVSLTMRPALVRDDEGQIRQMYPFGVLPRYLLTWMTTEAVRTQSPLLYLGENLSDFMRKLGLARTGGERGQLTRLNDQTRRLFGAQLTIFEKASQGDMMTERGANLSIASSWELFFSRRDPEGMPLWESTVTLSEEFHESVLEAPIPIDLGALRALSGAPLRMDIYLWLAARLPRVKRPTTVSWELLAGQFGSESKRLRRFRENFIKNLRYVSQIYPDANVEIGESGVTLRRSKPHVPYRQIGKR